MSATIYAPPATPIRTGIRPTREQLLATVLDANRLPTPPAVALQVVNAASRPDCDPKEIIALLGLDAALCGKLLKAVNSCLYGLKQPVASVARAVHVLGLKTVRSLALGLSLPAVKIGRGADPAMREFWISSVSGAILARELAILTHRPNPDDDLVSGLLRDLGEVLLRLAFQDAWPEHLARHSARLLEDPCGAELTSFGIDHADVSAELVLRWQLPADIVEPIRYHHQPSLLARGSKLAFERAELLQFVDRVVHLDTVAQHPDLLAELLATARDRFNLPQPALVEFLQRVSPKIEAFAGVLNQDIGQCPDFASILAAGATELVNLTVESSRTRLSGSVRVEATTRLHPASATQAHADSPAAPPLPDPRDPAPLPEFRPEFAEKLPEGGCRLGGFELRSVLGRGAMGVVFKAFEPSLHRYVAVKILAPELAASQTARQRFAREARAGASIQHDNVVAVYAVREAAGVTYLTMEYVAGNCLEARVQEHGPMPVILLVATARQIAAGLAAAHAKQVVHRDVKPANILIEADTGRAKLTDFGLARVMDDATMTADGARIGTPFYMAPEVVQGEAATPLSDLFSLGGVLYLMATGRLPFPGQTVPAVFHSIGSIEPAPPRHLRPNLPEWLEHLILRLLRKNPAERFPSAAAVAALLAERGG